MDISAQDILNSMFNADEKVCIRVFEDRKDGLFNGAKYTVECGKYNTIEETLRDEPGDLLHGELRRAQRQ